MIDVENIALRQSSADDEGLRSGLVALSQIVIGADSLEAALTHVARTAVPALRGAEGVGISLTTDRRLRLAVASHPFVQEIDGLQYDNGEGPLISAAAAEKTMRSGSLGSDKRWPKFAARMANLGVNRTQSALILPLQLPGQFIGTLNVYSQREQTFNEDSVRRGQVFAAAAVVVVANMQNLTAALRQLASIEEGLTSRMTIDQAIGIIRSRSGGTTDEALDVLRQMSQRDNRRVGFIADRLVEQAAERAKSRR